MTSWMIFFKTSNLQNQNESSSGNYKILISEFLKVYAPNCIWPSFIATEKVGETTTFHLGKLSSEEKY